MFPVSDISADVKRVLGHCDDATILNRVNAAVEILAAEIDLDTNVAFVDLCVGTNRCIALPDEVDQVLAVNIGGTPAQGHDRFFDFHLNGPGIDCRETSEFDWVDRGSYATMFDPASGFSVVAFLDSADDNNEPVRVYGYEHGTNRWVTSEEGGVTVDGFLVPTVYGTPMANPDAPLLNRITRISKGDTKGFIRLASGTGTQLADMRPYEHESRYRRMRLSRASTWARVLFRRRNFKLRTFSDLVPLNSPRAVVFMCQALKKYDDDLVEAGDSYYARAIELMRKKQHSVNPPTGPSIQIADRNLIADKRDRMDP
jgi:hypothetical protein